MQRAGVEEGRGGRTKSATLVELIEADHPVFTIVLLGLEEPHRNPHPEKLGGLHPSRLAVSGLVDDQIAIVEGLDPEVIKVEIGRGIKSVRQTIKVIALQQFRADPLDLHPVPEVALELLLVCSLEGGNAVPLNRPVEHFFVDVTQQNAGRELRKVGILFDERLRIQDDRPLQLRGRNFRSY